MPRIIYFRILFLLNYSFFFKKLVSRISIRRSIWLSINYCLEKDLIPEHKNSYYDKIFKFYIIKFMNNLNF